MNYWTGFIKYEWQMYPKNYNYIDSGKWNCIPKVVFTIFTKTILSSFNRLRELD